MKGPKDLGEAGVPVVPERDELAAVADAAIAAEHEAAERIRRAREHLAVAAAAESDARAEVDAAARLLREAQDARERADAQLVALSARIAGDSAANALSVEALRRASERRAADALRHGARRDAT
jgi:hypothetical protein